MKKLFITAAIATMFSVTAFADGGKKVKVDAGEKNVTYYALNQFSTDFAAASNIVWTVTPNCQKADFVIDDVNYTAFYNLSGEYLGLTQEVDYKLIPADTKKEIAAKYAAYTVNHVIKYQTQGAEPTVYFVDVKNAESELVLKVTPNQNVAFFQKIK